MVINTDRFFDEVARSVVIRDALERRALVASSVATFLQLLSAAPSFAARRQLWKNVAGDVGSRGVAHPATAASTIVSLTRGWPAFRRSLVHWFGGRA